MLRQRRCARCGRWQWWCRAIWHGAPRVENDSAGNLVAAEGQVWTVEGWIRPTTANKPAQIGIVWLTSAASWLFGAVTAPYVWRGLEWLGTTAGARKLLWQISFGVWWALPAIVAGVILLIENAGRAPDSML